MKHTIYILITLILSMSADFVKIPSYSLSPDKITLFERVEWKSFSTKQVESFKNLENNKSRFNELSENGRRRLLAAVSNMLYLSKNKEILGKKKVSKSIGNNEIEIEKGRTYRKKVKYNLTFTTLTLSSKQIHEDKDITRHLLGSFLDSLRRKWHVDNYIWKAERQENGNIHYHILTDKYIPWWEIREVWNRIQNRDGYNYVDRYTKKMREFFKDGFKMLPGDKRTREKQYSAYLTNKENNWTDPNSTDIHALYKVKNIAGYITKYVAKQVTKTSRTEQMTKLYDELDELANTIEALTYENNKLSLFDDDLNYEANQQRINTLQNRVEVIESQLEVLRKKGVTGRIWGQSRDLSKISAFSDVENFTDIPDIQIVDKIARYKHEVDLGNDKGITTYFFDINKTPQLKQLLNDHIHECLYGPGLLTKLTIDKAISDFEKERESIPVPDPPKPKFKQQTLEI